MATCGLHISGVSQPLIGAGVLGGGLYGRIRNTIGQQPVHHEAGHPVYRCKNVYIVFRVQSASPVIFVAAHLLGIKTLYYL